MNNIIIGIPYEILDYQKNIPLIPRDIKLLINNLKIQIYMHDKIFDNSFVVIALSILGEFLTNLVKEANEKIPSEILGRDARKFSDILETGLLNHVHTGLFGGASAVAKSDPTKAGRTRSDSKLVRVILGAVCTVLGNPGAFIDPESREPMSARNYIAWRGYFLAKLRGAPTKPVRFATFEQVFLELACVLGGYRSLPTKYGMPRGKEDNGTNKAYQVMLDTLGNTAVRWSDLVVYLEKLKSKQAVPTAADFAVSSGISAYANTPTSGDRGYARAVAQVPMSAVVNVPVQPRADNGNRKKKPKKWLPLDISML